MNPRIQELAEQCKMVYQIPGGNTTACSPEIEKFAELIILECIDYCGENLSKTVGGALRIHLGVAE
jgi:hypothetical protein